MTERPHTAERRCASRSRFAGVALAVLLATASGPAFTQIKLLPGPAAQPAAPAPAPAPPPTIPAIIQVADDLAAEIAALDDDLQVPSATLARIAQQFPERLAEFERDSAHLDSAAIAAATPLELSGRVQALTRLERQLGEDRAALQQEVDALAPRRARLRERQDFLATTREPDIAAEVPQTLRERLDRLDTAAGDGLDRLGQRLGALVGQIDRGASLQVRIREKMRLLRAELAGRQDQLLSFTAPPLWSMAGLPAESPGNLVIRDLRLLWSGLREYAGTNGGGLLAFALIYGGLLGIAMRFSRSGRKAGEDAPVDPAAEAHLVAHRPIAVVTLVWMLLGPELMLPEMAPALALIRGIFVILPIWWLLPELTVDRAIRATRVLLAAILVLSVQRVLLDDPFYGRIVQLGAGLVAIFTIRWIRRARSGDDRRSLFDVAIEMLGRAAPAILGAGFVATLLGALSLGSQLTDGVLFVGLALLAFVAADGLLEDLLHAFVRGPGRQWSRAIRLYPDMVARRTALLLRLVLVGAFVLLVPRIVPILDPLWGYVARFLAAQVTLGSISLSLLDIGVFALSVALALYAARFIRFLLNEDVFTRLPMAPGTAAAASRLIYYGAVTGGILFSCAIAGVELSKLTLVISALSVGIGFGLQNIVNNFVSGLVIAFEHPFREGDHIAVGTTSGRIRSIGLRASRISTFDGADIIVPNANLISGEVINWTLSDRSRRIEILIGVAYASDPREVHRILLEAAGNLPGVASRPAPAVVFKDFGPSSLDFSVQVWTPDADDRVQVESDARFAIFEALGRAGIEIPLPQLDLHVRDVPAAGQPLA